VRIPAGVEAGMQLTLSGEGHAAKNNGINGDLLVVIEEQEHPTLKREGNNLYCTTIISVPDAILGAEVEVPTLDGPYKVKIDAGTQSGTVIRLRGKGLPTVNGYGGTGDLYVKIAVWIPKKLEKDEKQAVEALRLKEGFKPNPNKDDRNFFEKIIFAAAITAAIAAAFFLVKEINCSSAGGDKCKSTNNNSDNSTEFHRFTTFQKLFGFPFYFQLFCFKFIISVNNGSHCFNSCNNVHQKRLLSEKSYRILNNNIFFPFRQEPIYNLIII
jgi:hypothetical protein